MGGLIWTKRMVDGRKPSRVPEWIVYPDKTWQTVTPRQAGLEEAKFMAWVGGQQPEFGKELAGQAPATGGVVIARGGCIVHTWGDPDFKHQSASLGKTFTRMALQLAVDDGLIDREDDLIKRYWSGQGELQPHKVLNHGHHRLLTFRHLVDMKGGFPVTNGHHWMRKPGETVYYPGTPPWADWTGNPGYDNYAHVEPGTRKHYSSGGYWRLSQVLTAIWKKDLKVVLDQRIMTRIGISSDRWHWLSGREVREDFNFYPENPGYGNYVDAPYEIDGVVVRGGPGWVVMSASDLARLGLLIATGGLWRGDRLICNINGNEGMDSNAVAGWGRVKAGRFARAKDGYFSFGKVATAFDDPESQLMADWVMGPVQPPTNHGSE